MLYALSKFISIPSVSNSPQHREDCRQGAIWLKKCLNQLGASQSTLVCSPLYSQRSIVDGSTQVSTGETTNPLVVATFQGARHEAPKKRVLFYGYVLTDLTDTLPWPTSPTGIMMLWRPRLATGRQTLST